MFKLEVRGQEVCCFNNISVISWRSALLVEETGVPGQNHRPAASHWQTLSHNAERDSNSQPQCLRNLHYSKLCARSALNNDTNHKYGPA